MGLSLAVAIWLFVDASRCKTPTERDKRLWRAAIVSATLPLLLSMFVNTNFSPGVRAVVFILQAMDADNCVEFAGIAILLIGLFNVFRFKLLIGLFGYSWVASTVALLAFTPSSIHRNYLVDGGFAIMLAVGLMVWGRDDRASLVPVAALNSNQSTQPNS
jgi:hypothetical protein